MNSQALDQSPTMRVMNALENSRTLWYENFRMQMAQRAQALLEMDPLRDAPHIVEWRAWAHRVAGTASVLMYSDIADAARHVESAFRDGERCHESRIALAFGELMFAMEQASPQ